MAGIVVPFARSVFLCDTVIGSTHGKVDLYGVFNYLRPKYFPFTIPRFVCFAQLSGGLGTVPFHFDIRRADDDKLIRCTDRHEIEFPDRSTIQFLVMSVENLVFDREGLYLVQLFCNNVWVADATLQIGDRS